MPWSEDYCETFCPIYEALGGDCRDLGCYEDGNGAAAMVAARYNDDGLPTGMTSTEKCDLLGDLNALETQLALPGNTLLAVSNTSLDNMIASMRSDIGIVPGCNN